MSFMDDAEALYKKEFIIQENSVFHYTNLDGYVGIIRQECFWLNPHDFLNKKDPDNREIVYSYDLILRILEEKNNNIVKRTYERIINEAAIFYSASFSSSKSRYTMHRKYGEYAIEVSSNVLDNFAGQNRFTDFRPVIYNKRDQSRIVNQLYDIYLNYQDDPESGAILATYLIMITPLFKHDNAELESEYRVIQLETFSGDNQVVDTPIAIKKIPCNGGLIIGVRKNNSFR